MITKLCNNNNKNIFFILNNFKKINNIKIKIKTLNHYYLISFNLFIFKIKPKEVNYFNYFNYFKIFLNKKYLIISKKIIKQVKQFKYHNYFNKFFIRRSIFLYNFYLKINKKINSFNYYNKNIWYFKKISNIFIIIIKRTDTPKKKKIDNTNFNPIKINNFNTIFKLKKVKKYFNFFFWKKKKLNINFKFYVNTYSYNYFLTQIFSSKFCNLRIAMFLNFLNDFFNFTNNLIFFSNKYLINYYSSFSFIINDKIKLHKIYKIKKFNFFNNYYPIILFKESTYNSFFKNFKQTHNMNYIYFTNVLLINFLENFLKKNIFLKLNNNFVSNSNKYYMLAFKNLYKNSQPLYFKNFFLSDFLEIIWYSFFLKDLNILTKWISEFMENLNFKNHKKFIIFFQNLILKNSIMFITILNIKGFFFDIRGKVGVTGSSKKRHLFFKIGSLNKSSKKDKICFNQSLVRTYSGVLGLTYILSY